MYWQFISNLAGAGIGNVGAKNIAACLRDNKTLEDLGLCKSSLNILGNNKIQHAGAKDIAEALEVNDTLKKLYLSKKDSSFIRQEPYRR